MTTVPLIYWDAPGPYVVAFSTRVGGVSAGPYATLNLGKKTGDAPANVDENRRRLCRTVGVDDRQLTLGHQHHSTVVNRARAGVRGEPGDCLWTDERGVPMLALGADCLVVAIARTKRRPALAVLHAGWRGLLDGVVAAGVAAVGSGSAAVIGPAIGPCCYEVREDVAEPFRRRFGANVVRGGKLDLWSAGEQALREAGCESVQRFDGCTACQPELFFSHRRDGLARGVQGVFGLVA